MEQECSPPVAFYAGFFQHALPQQGVCFNTRSSTALGSYSAYYVGFYEINETFERMGTDLHLQASDYW